MILEAMDKKMISALVLLDLSKAFDSINHQLFLQKLNHVGASHSAVSWFRIYLNGRTQSVRTGSTISSRLPITHQSWSPSRWYILSDPLLYLLERPPNYNPEMSPRITCRRFQATSVFSSKGHWFRQSYYWARSPSCSQMMITKRPSH